MRVLLWTGGERAASIRFPLGWGRPGAATSLRSAVNRVRTVPADEKAVVWSHAPVWEPDERTSRERVLWAFGAATVLALLPGVTTGGLWWLLWMFPGGLLALSALTFWIEWRTQATRAIVTRNGRLMVRTPRGTREWDLRAASRVDVRLSRSDPDAWGAES